MRIAVTSALSWPYIRRGNRCAYELALWLASRGHDVTFVTPTPGRRRRTRNQDGLVLEYLPLSRSPLLTLFKIERMTAFVVSCLAFLRRGGFDVVQATFPVDACAASLNRTLTRTPFVYMIIDCLPFHPSFLRLGRLMFRRGIANASRLTAISRFVDRELQREYGRRALVIPLAADPERFVSGGSKPAGAPVIFCAAAISDPRKRVALLVRAFELLRRSLPDAVLELSGHSDQRTEQSLLGSVSAATRPGIRFVGLGRPEDLPQRYRAATVSVLPSLREAFGMVIVESLASGTPVVATRSGAVPDILDEPGIGVLFEETDGPEELARALIEGIELARDPQTPSRCRRHAMAGFSWDRIGACYEVVYREVLAEEGRKPGSRAPGGGRSEARKRAASRTSREAFAVLFDEALDSLDLTIEEHGELDWHRPGCVRIAMELQALGWSGGPVLVVGPCTRPLALLLDRLGARVSELSPDSLEGGCSSIASEQAFDAVIASDVGLDQGSAHEKVSRLVRRLRPSGLLVLALPRRTAPEEPSWSRSRLADVVTRAGCQPVSVRHFLPTEALRVGWGSTPRKVWLRHHPAHMIKMLFPWLRSHLLIAARLP